MTEKEHYLQKSELNSIKSCKHTPHHKGYTITSSRLPVCDINPKPPQIVFIRLCDQTSKTFFFILKK